MDSLSHFDVNSRIAQLEAEKARLDAQITADKAGGLGISKDLAFAWWDTATELRDLKETK